MTERKRKVRTIEQQKGLILAPYLDMIEEGDPDGVAELILHAGRLLRMIFARSRRSLPVSAC
jgi:hypothetical protein